MADVSFGSRFCERIYRLAKQEPGCNMVEQHDGHRVVLVQDLTDADRILRTHVRNYPKNMRWFTQVLGNSRLTEDGPAWEFRRGLTQPGLSRFDPARATAVCMRHARECAAALLAAGQSGRLDEAAIYRSVMASLLEVFLDLALADVPIRPDAITRLIALASQHAFIVAGVDGAAYDKDSLREILALRKSVWQALQALRRPELAQQPLLHTLLQAELDARWHFALEKEVMMLFGAGVDTPACAIGWAIHLLAAHPSLQWRLQAEVDALPPGDGDAASLATALAGLAPLKFFIAETLRLFPPLPFVTRVAAADDRLSDIAVYAGDAVIVSLLGVNTKGLQRASPWLPDIDAAMQEGAAAGTGLRSSFVWGERVCGGRSFALVEMAAMLAVFLRHLQFEPADDSAVELEWAGQMRRAGGHRINVTRRC